MQSGFAGLQSYDGGPLRRQLDGYLRRILDTDFEQLWIIDRVPAWQPGRNYSRDRCP